MSDHSNARMKKLPPLHSYYSLPIPKWRPVGEQMAGRDDPDLYDLDHDLDLCLSTFDPDADPDVGFAPNLDAVGFDGGNLRRTRVFF